MHVQRWRGQDDIPSDWGRGVLTIGVFAGVHRGHQELIARAVKAARARGVPAVLMTFDPHPMEVVFPGSHPAQLTTLTRRAELAEDLGIDVFPGRAWEVMRTLSGSSLTYLQRSLDEGVVSATTRAYQNRPDEFAITREFDRTAAEFEQEFRALQRQDNVLSMPPGRAAATLRMRQAQQKIDDARVNGMSQSQMYRLRDYYRTSGSEEGAAAMQQLIDNLQEYRNHIRANALRDVREMQQ